jgi:hypothetical protein
MAKGLDLEKRQAWVARLRRFRASGLTIAKFCEQERVSAHTFHYWAQRIRLAKSIAVRATPGSAPTLTAGSVTAPSRVHFQFGGGVEVSIPADCLEAIRCLAQCIQPSSSAPAMPFHQVLVRDAARESS